MLRAVNFAISAIGSTFEPLEATYTRAANCAAIIRAATMIRFNCSLSMSGGSMGVAVASVQPNISAGGTSSTSASFRTVLVERPSTAFFR